MNDYTPLILIGLVCLAVGFGLGLLVSGLRSDKTETASPEPDEPGMPEKIAHPADSVASPSSPPRAQSYTAITQASENRPSMVLNPIDVLARKSGMDAVKATLNKSIAAQIDDILQEKLADSPLKNRGIRLLELPSKGMVVMVGLEQYNAVEDVPDEEARQFIRQSVAEWERRISID